MMLRKKPLYRWCLLFFLFFPPLWGRAAEKNPRANSDPLYVQLRTLNLGEEYCHVERLQLKKDIATIEFKEGTIFFLAPIQGRVTGAVFLGQGEIQVSPLLSQEQEFMRVQAGTPSLMERFDKMVLRFTDNTADEIKKDFKVQSGAPNSSATGYWQDYRKLLRKGRTFSQYNVAVAFVQRNLDIRLLQDLAGTQTLGFFSAYFEGKTWGNFCLEIDPLGAPEVSPEEFVLANLSDRALGIWTASHLKDHYKNGAPEKGTHQLIDMEHFDITALTKGKSLEATVKARFQAMEEGTRVLPFNLFPRLRVSKVLDDQGHELPFIQEDKDEDGEFAVILPTGLKKGSTTQLTFEYSGNDAVLDSGGGNFTLAARDSWYPNSGFGEDRATFEMTLKSPKDLTMVATGQPLSETVENGMKITRWRSDVPLAVAGFNYGRFKKETATIPKLNFVVETYANKEVPDFFRSLQTQIESAERAGVRTATTLGSLNTISMMSKAMQEAQQAIAIYSDSFGPLPYGRVAMTQQPFVNFGQAWPMLVYMPISAFLDTTFRHQLGLDWGLRTESFYRFVAAHEVSHQWWGHLIGWNSYRDQWLSEGFAQFSTSLFAQRVYPNDVFLKFWRELREQMFEKNKEGMRPSSAGAISLGYRLNSGKTGNVTFPVMYGKGAFIVHMIRMMMWDSQNRDTAFLNMMQDFVKSNLNQNVSALDFKRMVEKYITPSMDLMGNKTMDWYFNEWVDGILIPDYKLDYRLEEAGEGKVKMVGTLTQKNVNDSFLMRVPVYLEINGKIMKAFSQVLQGNNTSPEFKLMLPAKPTRVLVCANEDILCTTANR
jgi:hypothetical protein